MSGGFIRQVTTLGGNTCRWVASIQLIHYLHQQTAREDPLNPGATARWVAVAPKGAETGVILYLPDQYREHYRQVVG